jgi:hypothetical protein
MKKLASPVFRSDQGGLNIVLNWRGAPDEEFGVYATAFLEGARCLARRALRQGRVRDLDALPIVFLYRHALELSMKAIVLRGNQHMSLRGEGVPDERLWKTLAGHRLTGLLPHVRHVFTFVGWKWRWPDPRIRPFAEVQRILHDLDSVDPASFAFRYPTNKHGDGAVPHHFSFNLHGFVSVVDALAEALDTAVFGLNAEYDRASEVLAAVWALR